MGGWVELNPQNANIPSDRNKLHPDANKALDQNLYEGEKVEVIIQGLGDSAMIATNRRVFVFKRGLSFGATFGYKFTSWDYRNLAGVDIKTGLLSGSVALQGPGITGGDVSVWGNILGGGDSKNDAWKIPNAIPIGQVQMEPASIGVAKLRKLIANYQNTGNLSDLETLADLKNKGIITEEEFKAKKQQILGI